MKNENQFQLPLEEKETKIRITRLANGWYSFPKGTGPETPIPPEFFEDLERSGGVHWKPMRLMTDPTANTNLTSTLMTDLHK